MNFSLSVLNKNLPINRIIVRGITTVYTGTNEKRELEINFSPDQEFSLPEAKLISWFFESHKPSEKMKDAFYYEVIKFKQKNLLYQIILNEISR